MLSLVGHFGCIIFSDRCSRCSIDHTSSTTILCKKSPKWHLKLQVIALRFHSAATAAIALLPAAAIVPCHAVATVFRRRAIHPPLFRRKMYGFVKQQDVNPLQNSNSKQKSNAILSFEKKMTLQQIHIPHH